jgi:hypothetical protein
MKRKLPILIFLIIVTAFLYFEKDSIFTPKYLGDLHMHTTCLDGVNSYEEMVESALAARLNFIAITDHKICQEVITKCKAETKLLCIPGQEVTGKRLHILALNINKYISPNLPISKQVEEIHRQGGLAIAAHPNVDIFYYTDTELADSGFDAQECTGNPKERRLLPCVFNSDAHNTIDLGWQFNACTGTIKSFSDVKTSILSKKCSRSITLPLFSAQNVKVKQ